MSGQAPAAEGNRVDFDPAILRRRGEDRVRDPTGGGPVDFGGKD